MRETPSLTLAKVRVQAHASRQCFFVALSKVAQGVGQFPEVRLDGTRSQSREPQEAHVRLTSNCGTIYCKHTMLIRGLWKRNLPLEFGHVLLEVHFTEQGQMTESI